MLQFSQVEELPPQRCLKATVMLGLLAWVELHMVALVMISVKRSVALWELERPSQRQSRKFCSQMQASRVMARHLVATESAKELREAMKTDLALVCDTFQQDLSDLEPFNELLKCTVAHRGEFQALETPLLELLVANFH